MAVYLDGRSVMLGGCVLGELKTPGVVSVVEKFEFGHKVVGQAVRALRSLGYVVHDVSVGHGEDLRIESPDYPGVTLTVEVKGSRVSKVNGSRWGYRWLLYKHGYSVPVSEDLVMMACVSRRGGVLWWLIVPGMQVQDVHSVTVSQVDLRRYEGKWSVYLERWDFLPMLFAMKGGLDAS